MFLSGALRQARPQRHLWLSSLHAEQSRSVCLDGSIAFPFVCLSIQDEQNNHIKNEQKNYKNMNKNHLLE
jgi:hypothetical protein